MWTQPSTLCERINEKLATPFDLCGHEVFTSASIGIAASMGDYERAEDILRDADAAMYRAKSLGKARYEIFDEGMRARAEEALHLETDLRRAIERQEFFVLYQPIVSFATGAIKGFEALVRWRHPKRGLIYPGKFLPLAEKTGLINFIGEWVLREACRQTRHWQEQNPTYPPLSISVNVSSKQFAQLDLVERVRQILVETGLTPRSLNLEITENAVVKNGESAADTLQQLRRLGIKLTIADFGMGYSSLSYLNRFSIDTLKIDRSFISRMTDHHESAVIVRTIMMLARNLGVKVIAEGVETQVQMAQLRTLNCECGQGYFFSEPMEAEAVSVFTYDVNGFLPISSHSNNLEVLRKAVGI